MNLGSTGQEEAIGAQDGSVGKRRGRRRNSHGAKSRRNGRGYGRGCASEFGDAVYRSWLKPMTLLRVGDDRVEIGVPTQFLRDWVAQHYPDRIRALWNDENRKIVAVEFVVVSGAAAAASAEIAAPATAAPRRATLLDGDDRGMSAPLDPRFTFENFVVGKPNELAHAAARASPRRRSRKTCSRRSTRCSSMAASASARPI